jgi:hypothetical protein
MTRVQAMGLLGALTLWTGCLWLFWSSGGQHAAAERAPASDPNAERWLMLQDELGSLHQDVRALADALGKNLEALDANLRADQDEHASALELQLEAWRAEVGSRTVVSSSPDRLDDLLREFAKLRALLQHAAPGLAVQPVLLPEPMSAAATPVETQPTPSETPVASTATEHKERRFLRQHGEAFAAYQRRVPYILPGRTAA